MKSRCVNRSVVVLLSLLISFLTCPLSAQNVVTGDIAGTVTDPSGAVVPNAKVELKNGQMGLDKTVTTGGGGEFRFSLLKPGQYVVTITSPSFSTATRTVTVNLGQVTNASTALALGASETTVEVTTEAPLLETENGNIATTFDERAVQQLPNPGGDITYYAQTAPGITMNTSGSGYGNFSAFGLPSTSNLFTENGNDENDPFLNLNNSGSSNLMLGRNEVQEVAVVTNGYTGQYGRQAGANINYTTKSGTNAFHGNLRYDWNGRVMNANEYFIKASGQDRPFANNNQWAADFGGPIKKNKTFFYIDTEGLRYILPAAQDVYFPTPAFSTAVLNNIAATSPSQLPFYNQIFKLYQSAPAYHSAVPYTESPAFRQSGDTTGGCADFSGAGFGTGGAPCLDYFHATGTNLNKEWLLTGRVDQNIGTKDVLFFRFKTDQGEQPSSTDLINNALFGTQSNQPTYEGQVNWTHTFNANMVNNFIGSGSWYSSIFVRNSGEEAAFAALPYSTITFLGTNLATLGGTDPTAPDYQFPQGRNVTQYQITDDFSIIKGNHELKFGANYRRNDMSIYDNQILTGGYLNFSSITDFYNGLAIGSNGDFFQQAFTNYPRVPLAMYSLGLYAQDTWKVTPNLTLTLALRSDHNSNAVCQTNCYARLITPFTSLNHDATVPYNSVIDAGVHTAFPSIEAVAWQPRIGFSFNPSFAHNTVLRGGVGIFSDLYAGVLLDNMIGNAPQENTFIVGGSALSTPTPVAPGVTGSTSTLAANSNTSFMNGFYSGANVNAITAANPFFVPPNYYSVGHISNPKYLEWNLQVEQELSRADVLSVNYVGNHGYDLLVENPGLNAYATPGTGQFPFLPTAPADPRFGAIFDLTSNAISNYNGLVTSYTHRFTHGLQAQFSYTWSHALDEVSSFPNTPFNFNTTIPVQLDPNCLRCLNYGNSDQDIRHNFVGSWIWNMPWTFSSNKLLAATVGGWQIAGTIFARSGLPYSVIDSSAGAVNNLSFGTANGGFLLPSFLGGPTASCSSPASPCLSVNQFVAAGTQTSWGNQRRNIFVGPGYLNSDLNVMKGFNLTERTKLRVGANLYNWMNHPNFQAPNHDILNAAVFGQIFATVSPVTSPYGSFQGAGVSGRLIQLEAQLSF